MTESECKTEKAELTRLMRSIMCEVSYEVIDEHLAEYAHTGKKPEPTETEGCSDE